MVSGYWEGGRRKRASAEERSRRTGTSVKDRSYNKTHDDLAGLSPC